MAYLNSLRNKDQGNNLPKSKKRKWLKPVIIIVAILVIGGGIFLTKTGYTLNKISKGGILSSIVHSLPGIEDTLKGEKEGRINILLLGMRGENMPGGGLLADSIEVISIVPESNKISMVSIPRDLYVTVPGTSDKQKINSVHAYGEQKSKGQGLEDMKTIVSEVSGVPIHYAASINFAGFKQLVDAVGGIEITLDQPFEELLQFNEPHVCDSQVFTVPTGKFETKTKRNKKTGILRITAQYPLCTNPNTECGGEFKLPAGKQTLTGEQALCYARSRATSNDFERAKRQQEIIQLVKNKMTSIGTLTDFSKVNGMLNSLGDNARSDMQLWEMQKFYEMYTKIPDAQVTKKVLDNSEEGLLYYPGESEAGYILLPRGDNYDKIHELFKKINPATLKSDDSKK